MKPISRCMLGLAISLPLAVLPLAALPLGAHAQSASQDITLNASVAKFCEFTAAPTFSNQTNVTVGSTGIASSVVDITSATDANGLLQTAGFQLNIPAVCNFAADAQLLSINGGLTDDVADTIVSGTFASRIDYTANAFWPPNASFPASLGTNGTPNSASTVVSSAGPVAGDLVVTVTVNANNQTAVLTAGSYSDTLRITLTPQ